MGVAAFSIALVLALVGLLVNSAVHVSESSTEHEHTLTVRIEPDERKWKSDSTTGDGASQAVSQEQVNSLESAERQHEIAIVDFPESQPKLPPAKDWQAIADAAAKASVDEHFRQEESRASMWRQSHSIMFQAASNPVLPEEVPVLSDIRLMAFVIT